MNLNKKTLKKTFAYLLIGFFIGSIILFTYIARPLLFVWLDNKVYDTFLRMVPKPIPSDVAVIVDIDEKSLETFGQWPWSRYLLAVLAEKIANDEPASIALDILLAEPDRTSPLMIKKNLMRDFELNIDFEGLPDYLQDNDKLFADYISRMPVILGMYVNFKDNGTMLKDYPEPLKYSVLAGLNSVEADNYIIKGSDISAPLKIFTDVAPVGVINAVTDIDGVIRRIPAVIGVNAADNKTLLYPNLALQSVIYAYGNGNLIIKTGPDGIESLRVGNLTIPLEADGTLPVLFKGKNRTYKYISAIDILSDNYNPEDITGKMVFVGSSAPGLLDIRSIPLDEYYTGVEIHASAVDAMVTGNFISIPFWTPGLQAILILFVSMFGSAAAGRFSPYLSLPMSVLMLIGIWYGGYYAFMQGIFISPFFMSNGLILSVFTIIAIRFLYEAKEKKVLRNTFSRYVAPEIVAQITDKGFKLFSGEEKEVTAIFTDIRGFTSISEKLTPQDMVKLLNSYFAPMTDLIRSNQGTLDKFIGDAIMAFWNAPLDVAHHEEKAVATAIEMQKRLTEINVKLKAEFGIELRIGVGINTGSVYVGNMGSQELINYTIIGDNVNLASRLEGVCAKFSLPVICSGSTKDKCSDLFVFQKVDNIKVKGKNKAVEIYFAMDNKEGTKRKTELEHYDKALNLYTEGRFKEALNEFNSIIELYPNSITITLYKVYQNRCLDLIKNPPDVWEGIWVFDSK